jgi:MFS family permease
MQVGEVHDSGIKASMSVPSVPVRRDLRVISLIGVAHGSSHYYQLAFVTMLLILRERVGLSFEQIGFLGALFYAVSGFGQTAAGFAVDRFGARPILAAGLLALGCGLGSMAFAHSFAEFAGIAVLGGLGNSVFHPADFALLNASVEPRRIGRAFSIHGLGGSLGWAGGPAMYFLDSAVGDVNAALIGAVPGVVLSVLVWIHRRELVDHRIKARHAASQPSPWSLFLQPPILLCLAFFALVAASTVGIQQFAVPAFKAMFGVGQSYAAFCLIVFVLGSAGGMLLGGWLADRMRHHERVAAIGLLTAAVFTLPVALGSVSPAVLPFLLVAAGFAGGTTNPSRDMIVRQATPPGASGKVFGFVYSGLDIGSFVAPLVFGSVMNAGNPAAMFWITVGLYVFNAALVSVIRLATAPRAMPAAAE